MRKLTMVVVVLAGCGSSSRAVYAPEVRTDPELATLLEQIRSANAVPGMGAAIVHDDLTTLAVSGRRRVDREGALVDTDAFQLGSDTKAMTASIVARLVERGVLRWDETLADALPELAAQMAPAYRGVTIEMLLRHTAGVGDGALANALHDLDGTASLAAQRATIAARVLAQPPAIAPGTRFAFSNFGYVIAGHIVEHATGKSWEQLMHAEVFAPLGMIGCGFGATATDAHPDGNWGHAVTAGAYTPSAAENPPVVGPAGTVFCPLDAWARFAGAHAGTGPASWLSADTLAHLHAPVAIAGAPDDQDLALGWTVTRTNPPRLTDIGATGVSDAELIVVPSQRAAVLVACNAGDRRALAAGRQASELIVERLFGHVPMTQNDVRSIPPHNQSYDPDTTHGAKSSAM